MCNARSTTTTSSADASSCTSSEFYTVQTATAPCEPELKEIDISRFSPEELQSLKQDDPFLYYSIPAARRAALDLADSDMSEASLRELGTVKRCTRVSFECHTDLLLDDLMGDFEDEDYDESELDCDVFKLLGLAYAGNSSTKALE